MNAADARGAARQARTDLLGGRHAARRCSARSSTATSVPAPVAEIFRKGQQHKVPLLAGWNADECDRA
jgi:hypothetical protein